MTFLSPAQTATVAHIVQTLAPGSTVADDLVALLTDLAPPNLQRELRLFLNALENPAVNSLTTGVGVRFGDMTHAEREATLRAWGTSLLPVARKAFSAFKRLALYLHYTGADNPAWADFGYSPPPTVPNERLPIVELTEPTTLYADVLVVGSGAGGAVVAAELVAAGLDVLIAEKGDYPAEISADERTSMNRLYELGGMLTTADTAMNVLAGSTVGGSTVVNWSASFRPPANVLAEWAYGFSGASGPDFQASVDAVSARLNVNTDESTCNAQNNLFSQGTEALGYTAKPVPRNVEGCEDCGFCNFGCRYGAKQSTPRTYLKDAVDGGARLLPNADVRKIMVAQGATTGAEVVVGGWGAVVVRARAVVCAAGAIHTPALLLRSGLGNRHIGSHLHMHPTTAVYSLFEEPVRGWEGVPMAVHADRHTNLDGKGYGVRLETAPLHPGIAALAIPWRDADTHATLMRQLDHLANIIILARDTSAGRVDLNRHGNPVLRYRLNADDIRHLLVGITEALKIHEAAGAVEIHAPQQMGFARGGDFDDFLGTVWDAGLPRLGCPLFSAHQMSTCRVGANSAQGAVDPGGESFEVRNLFVADASVLPTASGVNPMLTTMSTAHYLAQHIKSRLA